METFRISELTYGPAEDSGLSKSEREMIRKSDGTNYVYVQTGLFCVSGLKRI